MGSDTKCFHLKACHRFPNASIYPSLFTIAVHTAGQQCNFLPKVKQGNFAGNAGGHLETNCLKEKVPSEKWHPRLQLCTSMAPLINRLCLSPTEEQRRGNGLPTDRSARRSYRLLHTS